MSVTEPVVVLAAAIDKALVECALKLACMEVTELRGLPAPTAEVIEEFLRKAAEQQSAWDKAFATAAAYDARRAADGRRVAGIRERWRGRRFAAWQKSAGADIDVLLAELDRRAAALARYEGKHPADVPAPRSRVGEET